MKLTQTLLNRAVETGTLQYDEARKLRDAFNYICDTWIAQTKCGHPCGASMKFYISPVLPPAFREQPPAPGEIVLEILEITP